MSDLTPSLLATIELERAGHFVQRPDPLDELQALALAFAREVRQPVDVCIRAIASWRTMLLGHRLSADPVDAVAALRVVMAANRYASPITAVMHVTTQLLQVRGRIADILVEDGKLIVRVGTPKPAGLAGDLGCLLSAICDRPMGVWTRRRRA